MKERKAISILAGILLAVFLVGCGNDSGPFIPEKLEFDSTPEPGVSQAPVPTPEPAPEDADQVRLLYLVGSLTEAEEAAATEALTTLYQNMEVPEYLGEAIHMVATKEWFDAMNPGGYVGGRSYTLQRGGLALLTVQIGEDSTGVLYADVRFQDADGRFLLLKQFGTVTQLLEAAMEDGVLTGIFTNWTIDSADGTIIREQGTYAGGVIVGEFTRAVREGTAGEAFDLWTHREDFSYTLTTVYYDEHGNPAATPVPVPTAQPTPAPPAVTAAPKPPAVTAAPKPPAVTAAPKPPVATAVPKPPAVTAAPTPVPQPPAPTAVPAPDPEPDDDDDGGYYEPDDDDYDEPDPEPDPTPEPEPDPTPEPVPDPTPEPDPPENNDVDQEWSPDVLG